MQRDCCQVLASQRSCCTDWKIRIDSNASDSFDLVFCTDHVEKALIWISGSPFSVNFRKMKLKSGEVMGTSLIDWILVFLRKEFHCFDVSSQDEVTGLQLGVACLMINFLDSLTGSREKISQNDL